jgi:hypothetical protein
MQSKSSSLLRLTALVVAAGAPVAASAASETFLNGQSIHGQPASSSSATRTVDLSQALRLNVSYGETVVFRGEAGQQFAWTFNGLDRRAVDLAKIAPPGFGMKAAIAYVGRDPSNRR